MSDIQVKNAVAKREGRFASKIWHLDQLLNDFASRNPYYLERR